MDQRRTLLVLRHAKTEDTRPGSKDSERRLTPDGERAALEVGDYLRTQGIAVDTVLCSSAVRARQTLDLLKLGDQLDPDRVEIADRFYNAGTDTLINAVRELPEDCSCCVARRPRPRGSWRGVRADRPDHFYARGSQRNRRSLSGRRAGPAGVRRRLV